MLTQNEIEQVTQKGIALHEIERQLEIFRKGVPFLKLVRPASIGDGIMSLSENRIKDCSEYYLKRIQNNLQPLKFVPASGAASRMFQILYTFLENASDNISAENLLAEEKYKPVRQFFEQIQDFAFFTELEQGVGGIWDPQGKMKYVEMLNFLLMDEGLKYGFLPKGLLHFHKYPEGPRTPVEEHMIEGALYCVNDKREVHIHFTVSPEHLEYFKEKTIQAARIFEPNFGVKYLISFSEQKPATDTIAVDPENNPFHSSDGSILFRPGGHGALLENLNEMKEDLIFIKNIDNVVPDRLKNETIRYKMALAGLLLEFQEKIFGYLRILEKDPAVVSDDEFSEIKNFVENALCVEPIQEDINSKTTLALFLLNKLNRPIRICGMVKNQGEPGGGPFWAKNQDGTTSLQIVESSQVDMKDPEQKKIAGNATHFNPVDLVCGVYNYKGEKFDLKNYSDPNTGFISQKSKDGKPLKALELPGLWNGAMSDWITLFVDVPVITFNPVKTVNDLLRSEHQSIE
jgi:hypothetical protein